MVRAFYLVRTACRTGQPVVIEPASYSSTQSLRSPSGDRRMRLASSAFPTVTTDRTRSLLVLVVATMVALPARGGVPGPDNRSPNVVDV